MYICSRIAATKSHRQINLRRKFNCLFYLVEILVLNLIVVANFFLESFLSGEMITKKTHPNLISIGVYIERKEIPKNMMH